MKKNNHDIDSDFLDVVKGSGIKDKIPIIILIFILLIIGLVVGLFIYNKIINYSYVKPREVNSIKSKTKNSEKNKVKPVNKNDLNIVDAKKEYYCPNGYILNGSKCIFTSTIGATANYSCQSGKLVGDTCIITKEEYAKIESACFNSNNEKVECSIYTTPKIWCPSGYNMDVSGELKCYKETITNIDATINYECPSEYTLSGSNCVKKTSIDASYNYKCDYGYKLEGSKCEK